jgi:hypothetical protein
LLAIEASGEATDNFFRDPSKYIHEKWTTLAADAIQYLCHSRQSVSGRAWNGLRVLTEVLRAVRRIEALLYHTNNKNALTATTAVNCHLIYVITEAEKG